MVSSLSDRFWSKVEKTATCWLWRGATSDGYGTFRVGRVVHKAYTLAYEDAVGTVPDGLELDHTCQNAVCVNPAHLEPVTHRENILRGRSPIAEQARQSHCIHGHPLDEANTYHRKDKRGRQCKTCRNRSTREIQRRKREENYALGLNSAGRPYKREGWRNRARPAA